ncbi:MAG: FAD-dependent oxidoreductase [Terracidiphilus sp.]
MSRGSVDSELTIVGAGPYGLSAASHLIDAGIEPRVHGQPMAFWDRNLPPGMILRSPREASTISDPQARFTLDAYETANNMPPEKRVSRETFVSYGKWFESHVSSHLDRRSVTKLARENGHFRVTLEDGSQFSSARVVVAAGIGSFKKTPHPFNHLREDLVSHCYDGRGLNTLGKRVAVIGAGQSALESAALLHEAGIEVEVVARAAQLRWIGMHKRLHELGPISKMLYSKHDVGPIGISRLVAYPNLVRRIPLPLRDRIRIRAVKPAGAPWLIPRLAGVPITTGRCVTEATEVRGQVELTLDDGTKREVDHVLLGTGYQADLSQYKFLDDSLLAQIRLLDGYPDVRAGFSSSVPGLHFIGAAAARTFGPLLYFVAGTEFTSRELTSFVRAQRNGHPAH